MEEDNSWRSQSFRQSVVNKINESIRLSDVRPATNTVDMENHVFAKARNRDEYLSFVARLVVHIREISNRSRNVDDEDNPQAEAQQNHVAQQHQDPINALQNLASQGTRSVEHQMTGQQQSGMIQWIQIQQLQNQRPEIIQPQMNPQMAQNQGNNGLLANQSLNAICSICMDVLSKNCVSTSCGHIYHGSCLEKWLITQNSCPFCRSTQTSSSLIKLFFEIDENTAKLLKSLEESELKRRMLEQERQEKDAKLKKAAEKMKTAERQTQMEKSLIDKIMQENFKLKKENRFLKNELLAERKLRRIYHSKYSDISEVQTVNYSSGDTDTTSMTASSSLSLPTLIGDDDDSTAYKVPSKVLKVSTDTLNQDERKSFE